MSISDAVDRRYRLSAPDLDGQMRPATICSVGYEGVEDPRPLLRFEGMGRPLALDFDQRLDMARITHSTLIADWVGTSVVLQPVRTEGRETIRLKGIEELRSFIPMPRRRPGRSGTRVRSAWRLAAIILIVVMAMAAVNAVEQGGDLSLLTNLAEFFGQSEAGNPSGLPEMPNLQGLFDVFER